MSPQIDPERARAGRKEGVVRYVLAISTIAAVVAVGAVLFFFVF